MMGADARLSPQTVLPGYEIYDDFTVPPTVTLTIEPGVTVFNLGELQVQGHLDAIGTTTSPVLFTGRSDTTTWRWKGLFFDGGTGDLRHVTVRYGGSPNSASISGNIVAQNVLAGEVRISDSVVSNAQRSSYTDAGMYVMDSHVTVSNTLFTQNGGGGGNDDAAIKVAGSSVVTMSRASVESNFYGLIIWGGQVAADGVVIEDNLIHGVRIASDSAVFTMTNSTVLLNDGDGVRNESAAQVTLGGAADRGNVILGNGGKGANQVATTAQMLATYNWWGDASGPTHPSNPGGLGEDVSDRVIFSPWLTSTPSLPVPLHTFVRGFAPASASPGEAVNLGVYFTNVATETLRDVVVIAQLPQEAGYLYSTGGGQYWPERHEVVWQLGDVAPGVGFSAVARVQYQWGLAPHSWTGFKALAAASNLANPALDPAEYLGYTPLTVLSEHYLTAEEITGTLSADPDLAARLQEAEAQGFTFYGVAVSRTLSNGATLDLFLTNRDQWREALMVRRASGRSSIFRLAGTTISEANPTGGWRYDDWAGEWSFWGDLDPAHWTLAAGENAGDPIICPDLTREQCYRNCLMESAAAWVSGQKRVGGAFGGVLSLAWKSDSCKECYTWGRYADCQACGLDIGHAMGKTDYFAPCARDCNGLFDDKNKHWCLKNKTKCFRLGWDKYSLTWLCDPATCTYSTQPPIKHSCPEKSICIDGIGCCSQDGTPIYPRATDSVCQAPACPLCQAGVCQRKLIEIRTAGDPNAMYGPEMVTPGELITYTIAYENVGEGTAYGVYIESKLPPELDTSTLQVADGGIYLPSSRLLLWHIGEVGPGAGGQVGFQVRVATGAVSGTIVAANAVVYFPSVPETTPTNDVVSLIQSVAAHPQWVETTEGVPVAVTLSGFSPTGNPLSYQIVDQPLNGTLSGVAPNLLYTPAANFEGLDALTFRVSDGVNQSWPAEVLIVVNTGAETIPPQVVATSPARNERDVPVYATPAYSNTYAPAIWVWFSEPISDTTVTTQTLFIADAQGRRLDNAVLYDATQDAALLMLHEPLVQMATYTVSVTTGVRDTSGNLLAADHVWSFRTVEAVTRIYLPLVMRDH
jgi:uncharacterized repeat protein (TIGR01451 family)